ANVRSDRRSCQHVSWKEIRVSTLRGTSRSSFHVLRCMHQSPAVSADGSISKQGDRYLRSLFTAGALAVIRHAKSYGTKHRPWLTALLARRPTKVAAIALARADGLGHDDQGRTLQRTRRAGGVNEIAPANRRDVKVGKGKQHVMQNRSIWRSG